MSTNFCFQMSINVLPLHFKQTFLPIIWIFTEGEEIESRVPFSIEVLSKDLIFLVALCTPRFLDLLPALPNQCSAMHSQNATASLIRLRRTRACPRESRYVVGHAYIYTLFFIIERSLPSFFFVMNLFYVSYFEVKLVKALFASRIRHTKRSLLLLNAIKIKSFFQKIFFKRKRKERVP